jgi:urokinase plasminogen activator
MHSLILGVISELSKLQGSKLKLPFKVPGNGEVVLNVVDINVHLGYRPDLALLNDPMGNDNDFALLKLNKPVYPSANVSYICLPSDVKEDFVGAHLIVSGWGKQAPGDDASYSEILMAATTVMGMSNFECQLRYYNANYYITPNMLCGESPAYYSDSCQGDSGGSLCLVNIHSYVPLSQLNIQSVYCLARNL